jgi:hypothetical protein
MQLTVKERPTQLTQQPPEIPDGNSPANNQFPAIINYNLSEGERPGGMKVRFKIKVETGRKARDLDARQAAAIKELLIWARQHQHQNLR